MRGAAKLAKKTVPKVALIICVSLLSRAAVAGSALKIGLHGGIGTFAAKSAVEARSEGPFAFGVSIDYDVNSRLALGAEHFRSFQLSPLGTSVGMTGFTGRWYAWGPVPNALVFDEEFLRARVIQQGMFPYVGWTFGFAQASVPETVDNKAVLALNLMAGAKAGIDYPIGSRFALRSELNLGLPLVGSGSISYMHLDLGLFYFW